MILADKKLIYADITYRIRGCLFNVYNELGFGHKEQVYQQALAGEFEDKKIPFKKEEGLKVLYKNRIVGNYKPDFIVEDKVIMELKAVEFMPKSYERQLINYLKATGYAIGLLVNFGSYKLIIRRLVWSNQRKSAVNLCKSILSLFFFVLLFYGLTQLTRFDFMSNQAFAQSYNPRGEMSTEIQASIGSLFLDVSGFISPYASLVMTMSEPNESFLSSESLKGPSSGVVILRTAVADAKGNFYFSKILIKEGFTGFCIIAVDFQRLGESTTCFSFPPTKKSISMKNVFLPPTIGLYKQEVVEGSAARTFGYTMPNSIVTLYLSNGKKLTVMADSRGYYEFSVKNLKAGKYLLFAGANYKGKNSEKPSKKLELKMLSSWEEFLAFLREIWNRIVNIFTSSGLGILWFAIPIIILIIILLLKLNPDGFTSVTDKFTSSIPWFQKKRLHHWWWMGY